MGCLVELFIWPFQLMWYCCIFLFHLLKILFEIFISVFDIIFDFISDSSENKRIKEEKMKEERERKKTQAELDFNIKKIEEELEEINREIIIDNFDAHNYAIKCIDELSKNS